MINEVLAEPPAVVTNQEPAAMTVTLPNTFKKFHDQKTSDRPGGPLGGDFAEYLMRVENSVKKGFKNGKWYPHNSVEGGSPTIAYGHKLKAKENFTNGLSEQEAMLLLVKDIRIAEAAANRLIDGEFGAGTWAKLSTPQKEMLTDFAFNGVLDKFPKFRKAVIENDVSTMKAQYKRYSKGKELTDRNAVFFDRYLSF